MATRFSLNLLTKFVTPCPARSRTFFNLFFDPYPDLDKPFIFHPLAVILHFFCHHSSQQFTYQPPARLTIAIWKSVTHFSISHKCVILDFGFFLFFCPQPLTTLSHIIPVRVVEVKGIKFYPLQMIILLIEEQIDHTFFEGYAACGKALLLCNM